MAKSDRAGGTQKIVKDLAATASQMASRVSAEFVVNKKKAKSYGAAKDKANSGKSTTSRAA